MIINEILQSITNVFIELSKENFSLFVSERSHYQQSKLFIIFYII